MDIKLNIKRTLIILTAIITVISFMPLQSNAATGKYKLVKTVTYQVYDEDAGKWVTSSKSKYTYNKKGDPIKVKDTYYKTNGKVMDTDTRKMSYTYKSGKRKYRKMTDSSNGSKANLKWTFNKKGNVIAFKYNASWTKSTSKYTYRKGWLKTETITDSVGDSRKFKYNSTLKNSLPTKVAEYVKDGKTWERMQTYKFNGKGLVTSVNYADYMGGGTSTVKYTMKNGRPAVATIVNTDTEGNTFKCRYKMTYSTKKTTKKRFAKMINDVTGGGSNYFNWY